MRKQSLDLLLSQEIIQKKIAEAAQLLDAAYAGKEITIIFILKGAVCLVADLIRHIQTPCTIDFLQAKSYGARGHKRGKLQILGLDKIKIASKEVLVVDDIFDSGETLQQILASLKRKRPKSLKSLVLLSKKKSRKSLAFQPDYILFEIEDHFVVGYGLDYKEHYRGLPGIYAIQL